MYFEPVRHRGGGPTLVDQTVEALEDAIRAQRLRPGMSLPSIRAFARQHGLSTFTVAAAYNRMVAKGWLHARAGVGYRVSAPVRPQPAPAVSPGWSPPHIGASWLLADVFEDHSIPIKSGCGWLPPEWLNEAGLQHSLRQMARVPVNQVAGYGHPYGYFPLRQHLCHMMEQHGLQLDSTQVLLTQGATQALDIVIRTLLRPGQVIVVEQPCYANILPLLRLAGLTVLGVPRTASGLCTESLQELARHHDIKALFINTVLQNPTGATMTMANAFRVLQLAEQHNFRIIEDDVSRDLLPGLAPMLAALGGTERVIYVSGFSKNVMPSMRVGYVLAAAPLLTEFARTKMAMSLTSCEMMERTVYQVLRQGRHRAHVERLKQHLHQAHSELYELMDQHGFELFARPRAGLFVWARLPGPWREKGALALAALALQDGIWMAPGAYFDLDQADEGWIRFNVAYSGHPALWRFMARMGAGPAGTAMAAGL